MAAPTRRAPPVISTVLPARLWLLIYDALYDFSRVPHNPAAAERRGTRTLGARAAHIREFIAAQGGVIGFDAYMRLALYAPGLGYYSAGAAKLGGGGDFVTAPEVSSLFSRCLARQAAEILRVTGGDILELGAGLGTMAADVLARARGARLPAGALSHPRSERGSRRAPARAHRAVAGGAGASGSSG